MRVNSRWTTLALAAGLALLSPAVQAHTSGAHGAGIGDGFAHPFGGLDHLLAMVTVGLWAAQRGGASAWALPGTFMAAMAAGLLAAVAGIGLPMVETGIAASVLILGLVVALALRPALWVCVATVGVFAVFHGHAHGTELPEAAAPALYGLGMLAATALLHGAGIALSRAADARLARLGSGLVRLAGAAVALGGLVIAAG